MSEKKANLVVKSNHLVEASYRLDLIEQRIILAAIVEARESQQGLGDGHITLEASRFVELFRMETGSVYEQLKNALMTLFNRFVVVRDIDPETGHPRVSRVRWISTASYIDGAGRIQLRFAQDMVPYITRLESEFTTYRLEKIGRMSSAHAVRLYELLIQYISIGQREIEIEWLKEVLQVKNEYPRITDLKKRVIDVAVTQINEYSDLLVDYTQRKTGRVVTHLVFKIRAKPEPKPAAPKKPSKPKTVDRAYVEKHARPGETYDQAYRRLLEEAGQKRLDV